MTRGQLYKFAFICIPLIYFLSLPITVDDLAGWTAVGCETLNRGHILREDIFSVYPTREWVYTAGVTVLYAALFKLGGLVLVSILHKITLLTILLIIYKTSFARLTSPWNPKNACFTLLFWLGASPLCIDRPAMLALLPLLIGYLLLDQGKEYRWPDWGRLCLLGVLWHNIHGSSITLLLMALWRLWAHHGRRDLMGTVVLAGTYLLNPFGFRLISYVSETRSWSKSRVFVEWAGPTPFSYPPQGALFYGLAVFLAVVVALRMRRGRRLTILQSPIWVLAALGFDSIRNTVFPFLVLLPFAAKHGMLSDGTAKLEQKRPLNAAIAIGLVLCVVAVLPCVKPYTAGILPENKSAVFDYTCPFKVAEYLRNSPVRAPVFNGAFGSFLMLMQSNRIFYDFRNIIYSDETYQEYLSILGPAPDWEAKIDKYHAGFIVVDRGLENSNLLRSVRESPHWKPVLVDGRAVLFERRRKIVSPPRVP